MSVKSSGKQILVSSGLQKNSYLTKLLTGRDMPISQNSKSFRFCVWVGFGRWEIGWDLMACNID